MWFLWQRPLDDVHTQVGIWWHWLFLSCYVPVQAESYVMWL